MRVKCPILRPAFVQQSWKNNPQLGVGSVLIIPQLPQTVPYSCGSIEHISDAVKNTYEQACPICGQEMLIKESDEGGIFWQCVSGDYSRSTVQQYPLDGILRCKCGAPYVFSMKNEPRWVCSADSRHYQKMRESDLKLEKMAALIPTKTARKEVDRYFAQKKKTLDAKKKTTAPRKATTAQKNSQHPSKDIPGQIKMF